MVYDVITFNGEYDILEIRLSILDKYVDEFIICESPTTFSGNFKPLYFEKQQERYKKWLPKIKYFVIDEKYSDKEIDFARKSPNTQGASHWVREFLQKESIKKALVHLEDEDRVFIGDCDEIWEPVQGTSGIVKLKLRVYTYYINNRSNEQFWGTITAHWKDLKDKCLNHVRSGTLRNTEEYRGWHFTSMKDDLKRKLEDSYTQESYATPEVLQNLEQNIEDNRDFLGRDFSYSVDESEWPQYLKENREKYKHLIK